MQSWDHANSEYVFSVEVNRKGTQFIGNKLPHLLTHSQTYLPLYISTDVECRCLLHRNVPYYAPPQIGGGIKRCFCLTSLWHLSVWRLYDVGRLSVAYIGPKSRTERPRKTKNGTEVAHVIRDSDTTFKVKRSKVMITRPLCKPPYWRVRRLQRWAWERVGRGKLLLRCRLLGGCDVSGLVWH